MYESPEYVKFVTFEKFLTKYEINEFYYICYSPFYYPKLSINTICSLIKKRLNYYQIDGKINLAVHYGSDNLGIPDILSSSTPALEEVLVTDTLMLKYKLNELFGSKALEHNSFVTLYFTAKDLKNYL